MVLDTKEYTFRGVVFKQFFQNVPESDFLYTEFEKNYDVVRLDIYDAL